MYPPYAGGSPPDPVAVGIPLAAGVGIPEPFPTVAGAGIPAGAGVGAGAGIPDGAGAGAAPLGS